MSDSSDLEIINTPPSSLSGSPTALNTPSDILGDRVNMKPKPLERLSEQTGQSHLCGYYYDEGGQGFANGAQTQSWFTSQPLKDSLLKRLNSIQLITSSHNKGSDVTGAKRSWFELSIQRDNDVRWMSHENRFKTEEYQRHDGRVFTKHSDILKSLKDGDIIHVHAAAEPTGPENHYKKGLLIYGIGCKDSEQPLEDSALDGLLGASPKIAVPTFTYLSDTTPTDVRSKIDDKESIAVVVNLNWESWKNTEEILSIADQASKGRKNVLLVFDAEDLPVSEETTRRLSWDQTVENLWTKVMEGHCREFGEKVSEKKYVHLLVRIGFEGAIYKGFETKETKAHLIYEPTSAKGSFLRSYSDEDIGRFKVGGDKREKLKEELRVAWMDGLKASLKKNQPSPSRISA
ncbi:hypothetical protein AbraIFM66951_000009 [Aspergillus brasiliensis]|uniref:Uncharacterized protein n=1 Tax=Aspergillus brasiliensis TaxID=319629 RepID=A0A9W6DNI1_9EURO|nr:hypothetical protein AbraCBS73388_009448 [Aspergillus brasiliensis]GKZ40249.1 hypothetical protein AbraIFM66951_000009 [Aspergillus brasiliensis]